MSFHLVDILNSVLLIAEANTHKFSKSLFYSYSHFKYLVRVIVVAFS